MKSIDFSSPSNYEEAPYSGWSRSHWDEAFKHLMRGIMASASPLGARQHIPGPRSHHGRLADELEGFTRSFIMAGPWLTASGSDSFSLNSQSYDVASFYSRGILAGTDPASIEYWGDPVDFAQHLVECASLAWSLWLSRERIWDRYSESQKAQVAAYLYACTGAKYHPNNWLLFNVVTNAVLKKLGRKYRQDQIDENLGFCDKMYLGAGWYQDGDVPRIDYYNAWAFHYYYLMWAVLDGDSKPEVALKHRARAKLFMKSLLHFMAADGETPCFGRSEIYRFAQSAPIALSLMLDDAVPMHSDTSDPSLAELRTFADLNVKWYLTKDVLSDEGHLSLGYVGPCADMLEHYSCGGSPYWGVKAFNLLALDKDHPFWTTQEAPLPIHKGSFSFSIPEAGLSLSGIGFSGQTVLLNHKARHDKAEYNDKYTKFAYATGFPYQARHIYGNADCDAVLQFSNDGTLWHQRWKMENLASGNLGGASRYPLFETDPEGEIITTSLLHGDLLIHLHEIRTTKSLYLREGSFAVGSDQAGIGTKSLPADPARGFGPGEAAYVPGRLSLIRSLGGWQKAVRAESFADDRLGANVRWAFSKTARLETELLESTKDKPLYLASLVAARLGSDAPAQVANCLLRSELVDGVLRLSFSDGVTAILRSPGKAGSLIELVEKDGSRKKLELSDK